MDMFGWDWTDGDGNFIEFLYWTTKGRFYIKVRENGLEQKARRISEASYISAWENYKNY